MEHKDFELVPYVIEHMTYCLEYLSDGHTYYINELGYELFQYYNMDGSMTYSTYKAKEFIKQNWDECSEFYEYCKNYYGEPPVNPFERPEAFMVHMCIVAAEQVIYSIEDDLKAFNDGDDLVLMNPKFKEFLEQKLETVTEINFN